MGTAKTTGLSTTKTSFEILETLYEMDGGQVTEVAERTGLPNSTVHTHLKTLYECGYLIKSDGQYEIGLKFLRLGEYARRNRELYEVAKPEVEELAEQTGEVASLMVEEHGQGVCIYKYRGPDAVNMNKITGKQLPLHTTALGKAILAHLADERVSEIVERHGLTPRSPNTITDRDTLFAQLETVREQGHSFSLGERLPGLRCVAAPIFHNEDVIGAVSVSGPESRMQGDRFREELPALVKSTANIMELNISYEF